jgi:hypothetical protein
VFADYLAGNEIQSEALKRIAGAAMQRGLSVRGLAKLTTRHESTIRGVFEKDDPQRRTIDALAVAVGIDSIRLHAELGDMNDAERTQMLSEVIRRVRLSDAFSISPRAAAERFTDAFRSAEPSAQNAALGAFVLAEVKAPPRTEDLLAEALAEIDGAKDETAEAPEAGQYSYADLLGTTALRRFAEALGANGASLLSLFREWEPRDAALWTIANDFAVHLGFSHREIRQCLKPIISKLRRRCEPRLSQMLEYARIQPKPFFLEE